MCRSPRGRAHEPEGERLARSNSDRVHLNDPRERLPESGLDERARFYFEMLNLGFEGAIAGLMQEHRCDRPTAIQKLAESYERLDREKLEALKRQATILSRAG